MPQKAFAYGAAPRRLAPTQEVHLRSWLSASIFGPWGLVRLLIVTPISGYGYVRVSNNKNARGVSTPCKCSKKKTGEIFGEIQRKVEYYYSSAFAFLIYL